MSTLECPKCGTSHERTRAVCPKCGTPNKKAKHLSGGQVLIGLGIAAAFVWWVAQREPSGTSPSARSAPSAPVSEYRRIKDDKQFGCVQKDTLNALVRIASEGDSAAFQRGLMRELRASRCILFEANTEVFLVDFEMLSGIAQVRPRGDTLTYWTVGEALAR